jgi:hypothetical protein
MNLGVISALIPGCCKKLMDVDRWCEPVMNPSKLMSEERQRRFKVTNMPASAKVGTFPTKTVCNIKLLFRLLGRVDIYFPLMFYNQNMADAKKTNPE